MTNSNVVASPALSVTVGTLDAITVEDAIARVQGYCTHPSSGWSGYDLAGILARREGHFETVGPWDILLAALMNARPTLKSVLEFNAEQREKFAQKVANVDRTQPIASMDDAELSAVVDLCAFGFKGAWAPTITKMAALYRPHAVPVLDGHVAEIFKFRRNAFSVKAKAGERSRRDCIRTALEGIRLTLSDNPEWLAELRKGAEGIPGIEEVSDVRLLDIVLWTSWDDQRVSRPGEKQRARWVERGVGPSISVESMKSIRILNRKPEDS